MKPAVILRFVSALVLTFFVSCSTQPVSLPENPPVPPGLATAPKKLLSPKVKGLEASLVKAAAPVIQLPAPPHSNQWAILSFPSGAASYTVYQRTNLGTGSWQVCTNVSTNTASILMSKLIPLSFFTVMASTSSTRSVVLEWDPSPDTNVVGYKIYYGVGSRVYTNIIDVGGKTNGLVAALMPGVTYYFAATAYNRVGIESDYSAEVSYTVPTGAVGTPFGVKASIAISPRLPAVTNLTATNIAATTAKVGGAILDTGGDLPITMFFYGTGNPWDDPNADWQLISVSGTSTNQVWQTLTNLTAGTTYYYSFAALNATGLGQGVPSMSFTTTLKASFVPRVTLPGKRPQPAVKMKKTVAAVPAHVEAHQQRYFAEAPVSFSVPAPPPALRVR